MTIFRKSRWFFHLALLGVLGAVPYAFGAMREGKSIPSSLRDRNMHPRVVYLDPAGDELHCPSGIFEHLSSGSSITQIVQKLDLSPDCVWKTIRKNAASREEVIHGFSFGSVSEISATAGAGISTELVIMKYDEQALMVGQVYTESGIVSLGLPGVSLTQSVIFGDCRDGIFGYLGWFDSVSALTLSRHFGKHAYDIPGMGEYSGCNALTSTRGTTAPLLGASQSFYHQEAPFVLVSGSRAQPMLEFLSGLNRGK